MPLRLPGSLFSQNPAIVISLIAFVATSLVIYFADSSASATAQVGLYSSYSLKQLLRADGSTLDSTTDAADDQAINDKYKQSLAASALDLPSPKRPQLSLKTWKTDYSYVLYADTTDSLCNAVMILDQLAGLKSKANRLLIHPHDWSFSLNAADDSTVTSTQYAVEINLLRRARNLYGAQLQSVQLDGLSKIWGQHQNKNKNNHNEPDLRMLLLLGMSQTSFKRVITLDTEGYVLKSLDDLFLEPFDARVAAPRAYWESQDSFSLEPIDSTTGKPFSPVLSASLMLIKPSREVFDTISLELEQGLLKGQEKETGTDTETGKPASLGTVNSIYNGSVEILPQRGYMMLTSELRESDHTSYLGSFNAFWDAATEIHKSYYVRFSDPPYPKVCLFVCLFVCLLVCLLAFVSNA